MTITLDTRILVSALVFPGGLSEAALQRIVEEVDELLLSKSIADEVLEVLARKFGRDTEELSRVAVFLSTIATLVSPRRRLRVGKDDRDNRVLERAQTGRAQAIVIGDGSLLAVDDLRGGRLISLRDYLDDRTV